MSETKRIRSLDELIGSIVWHKWDDGSNEWSKETCIKCVIADFGIEIETTFPYGINITAKLEPLAKTKQWIEAHKEFKEAELKCLLYNGRHLESLCFEKVY